MRSLVTGGSGFVGQHLVKKLGPSVLVGRSEKRLHNLFPGHTICQWDQQNLLNPECFDNVDAVFHLAGESVFKGRWTTEKKERILQSRVEGTRNLVNSMAKCANPPSVFICASAIGFYGDQQENLLNESSPAGNDFLATVCTAWEKEAAKAEKFGTRVVQIRTGIVLGKDGGALPQMLLPFRLGAGGRLGSGKQYMSWIHIDDLIGIMLHAASHKSVKGPVNGVSPNPVTNARFTKTLASTLKRPAFLHVPGCVLKLTLGEFADALLSSQRVVPEKIMSAGYQFIFPELDLALQNLLQSQEQL